MNLNELITKVKPSWMDDETVRGIVRPIIEREWPSTIEVIWDSPIDENGRPTQMWTTGAVVLATNLALGPACIKIHDALAAAKAGKPAPVVDMNIHFEQAEFITWAGEAMSMIKWYGVESGGDTVYRGVVYDRTATPTTVLTSPTPRFLQAIYPARHDFGATDSGKQD